MENLKEDWKKELSQTAAKYRRRLKSAKKYVVKAQQLLEKCQKWNEEKHLALLIQANLYQIDPKAHKASVLDWEQETTITIVFEPSLKPHEEVARRFKQAKKLQAGLPHSEQQLHKAQNVLEDLEKEMGALQDISTVEGWLTWKQSHSLPERQKFVNTSKALPASKAYWEYFSENQIPIWVGKNAAMNEALTFKHASGNDPWLHVTDVPGSHIVVHLTRNQPMDTETLNDALQLALHHSKARNMKEAEVSMTFVKYVKRFGKEKGKVQIAKEQRFFVRLDQKRLSRLHSSSSLKR